MSICPVTLPVQCLVLFFCEVNTGQMAQLASYMPKLVNYKPILHTTPLLLRPPPNWTFHNRKAWGWGNAIIYLCPFPPARKQVDEVVMVNWNDYDDVSVVTGHYVYLNSRWEALKWTFFFKYAVLIAAITSLLQWTGDHDSFSSTVHCQ